MAETLIDIIFNNIKCDANNILIGIGKEYNSLDFVQKSYKESLEVIECKKKFGNSALYFYDSIGIFKILPNIFEQFNQQAYENEKLNKLQEHDKANYSDLIRTLQVYLKNNCKMKETSDVLFIHTNTLYYRLKKISKITNLQFEEFEDRMTLYLDLLYITKTFV